MSSLHTYTPNPRSLSLLNTTVMLSLESFIYYLPFQGSQSLHLFLFGGRWRRKSINVLLFTEIASFPSVPMSYAENASVLSPVRMEGDKMGLWQPLIPWEHLAFLEAKGGVWAPPPPHPGQVPYVFLGLAGYTVLSPSWKKKGTRLKLWWYIMGRSTVISSWAFRAKTESEAEKAQQKREGLLVYGWYKRDLVQRHQEIWGSTYWPSPRSLSKILTLGPQVIVPEILGPILDTLSLDGSKFWDAISIFSPHLLGNEILKFAFNLFCLTFKAWIL